MSRKEFKEKGYTVVKNALSKELIDFITQYALFDEMQDFKSEKMQGMTQVPNAHSKYGDPAMEALLLALQPVIEKSTGLKVLPTYSFYRVYRPGDSLAPHKDREACELSITVSLGFDYSGKEYSWPIYIDDSPIHLNPGDLACYRGIELEHWRQPFDAPENAWHVQAFLHYVDANGPHTDWKWDKRPSIGYVEKNTSNTEKNQALNKTYIKYV